MIVFHDEGIHLMTGIAVPVGSPAVYQTNDDNTAVTGAYAHELASSSIMLLKKKYVLETDELSYCQGIVADGQYQSDVDPVLSTFVSILWDPGQFFY